MFSHTLLGLDEVEVLVGRAGYNMQIFVVA